MLSKAKLPPVVIFLTVHFQITNSFIVYDPIKVKYLTSTSSHLRVQSSWRPSRKRKKPSHLLIWRNCKRSIFLGYRSIIGIFGFRDRIWWAKRLRNAIWGLNYVMNHCFRIVKRYSYIRLFCNEFIVYTWFIEASSMFISHLCTVLEKVANSDKCQFFTSGRGSKKCCVWEDIFIPGQANFLTRFLFNIYI